MLPIRYLGQVPRFHTPALTLRGLGIREVMPPCFVQRPQGTGDYLFMLFHDPVRLGEHGTVFHEAGTVILWPKGVPHFYGNPLARWSHSWVHCDGPAVARALRAAKVPCGKPLANTSASTRYLLDLHEELTASQNPNAVVLRNTLENFIQQAVRPRGIATAARSIPAPMLAAREQIETRYDEPLTLEALAAGAGLSPAHFCTQFRQHFGIPPVACLVQRRMRAAAALLKGTNLPVGEVGSRVGCGDPFYFSKLFKNCFGKPPSQFRG